MKKELMFHRTGHPSPSFLIARDFHFANKNDYIGCYSEDNLCRGAAKIIFDDQFFTTIHGNDSTKFKNGFDYDEEIRLFYYDTKNDQFFSLTGEYYLYIEEWKKKEQMNWAPLGTWKIVNLKLGEEIFLDVDEELTKVKLEFDNPEGIFEPGDDDEIKLPFNCKNVENISISSNGKGHLFGSDKSYRYFISPQDTDVEFKITGEDIFNGSIVIDTHHLLVNTLFNDPESIWEDERIRFYLKDNALWAKPKVGKLYLNTLNGIVLLNREKQLVSLDWLNKRYNEKVIIDGTYKARVFNENQIIYSNAIEYKFELGLQTKKPKLDVLYENDHIIISKSDTDIYAENIKERVFLKFNYFSVMIDRKKSISPIEKAFKHGLKLLYFYYKKNGRFLKKVINENIIEKDQSIVIYNSLLQLDTEIYANDYLQVGYSGDDLIIENNCSKIISYAVNKGKETLIAGAMKPRNYTKLPIGEKILWSLYKSNINGEIIL